MLFGSDVSTLTVILLGIFLVWLIIAVICKIDDSITKAWRKFKKNRHDKKLQSGYSFDKSLENIDEKH